MATTKSLFSEDSILSPSVLVLLGITGLCVYYFFYKRSTTAVAKTTNFDGWKNVTGTSCTALIAEYNHWKALFDTIVPTAGGTSSTEIMNIVTHLNDVINKLNTHGCGHYTPVTPPPHRA